MPEKHHNSTRPLISSRNKAQTERHLIEVSAGGLVFRRVRGQVQFAMVRDSYERWTFPKGHVQAGETYSRAANREIREETGLNRLRFVRPLGHIDIWFRDRFVHKGKLVHKYIHYYLFETAPTSKLRRPPPVAGSEQITGVTWVPAEKILERSSYKDLRPIIRQAIESLSRGTRGKLPAV
jgi:diadenosine hexaphosphate hydrolase (ATP-forming)